MKFYRRQVLDENGSMFEGRWQKNKDEFMKAIKKYSKPKALGEWQEQEIDVAKFNFFWEEEYEEMESKNA